VVAEEVLALAKELPGPVLDFGCGSGPLVRALREGGVDARGLELDRPAIADSIAEDVRPHITLYAGSFPTPFPDKTFASVVLVEVLEHISDYEAALGEAARLTREHLLITVPDISAIPQCYPHHVVPWHLLESTHLNFFTQQSLTNALAKHFRTIEIAKICSEEVDGTRFFTNLVARCRV
jgi:SAM-dependent methyltransferase